MGSTRVDQDGSMPIFGEAAAPVDLRSLPIGVYRPEHEPLFEFDGQFDGQAVRFVIYGRAEWEGIPQDQRPVGAFSHDRRAVLCVTSRGTA